MKDVYNELFTYSDLQLYSLLSHTIIVSFIMIAFLCLLDSNYTLLFPTILLFRGDK